MTKIKQIFIKIEPFSKKILPYPFSIGKIFWPIYHPEKLSPLEYLWGEWIMEIFLSQKITILVSIPRFLRKNIPNQS